MKVGFFQFKPEFGKVKENADTVTRILKHANFDLIVLPELANSGYFFTSEQELEQFSEDPSKGIFTDALKWIASKKNAYIVSGFCEKSEENNKTVFYNSSILVYPNGDYKIYRKLHLFLDEKKWFRPGNLPLEVFEISGEFGKAKVGMMICFDWIYPEIARTLALKGAQIICHPSNLVMPYCQQSMYARAIENRVSVVTANRIGKEKRGETELRFTGKSIMVGIEGKYLDTAGEDTEEVFIADINQNLADNKMINSENNLFEDRRPEFYFK